MSGTFIDRDQLLHPGSHQHTLKIHTLVYAPRLQHNELGLRMTSSSEESNLKSLSQKLRDIVQVGIDNVGRSDRLVVVAERHPMPLVLLPVKILLCDLAAMRVGRSGLYSLPWDGGLKGPRLVPYHTSVSSLG